MTERRNFSRRAILRGGFFLSGSVITPFLMRDTEPKYDLDIQDFSINIIAHNAAIDPHIFNAALLSRAPHIEVDLTIADGRLVVAHSPEEFFGQSPEYQANQDPEVILKRIVESGHIPFLDLKDEITELSAIQDFTRQVHTVENAMASSNNHELLLRLKKSGFAGKILFSIGTEGALGRFLSQTQSFPHGEFGVSIRHTLLQYPGTSGELRNRGLSIAAWNPVRGGEITRACINGANFITSDNFQQLSERIYRT